MLLERGVVLLVHHDHPQVAQRREHRRAGADDDAGLAAGRAAPGGQPLAVGELRMQRRDGHAEALAEARHQLRGQADLRAQHQRGLAAGQHLVDQPQVNLGLAAAGHAVQQEAAELAQAGAQAGKGRLLRLGERMAGLGPGGQGGVHGRCQDVLLRDQATLEQGARGLAPARQPFGQVQGGQRALGGQQGQQFALLRGAAQAARGQRLLPCRGRVPVGHGLAGVHAFAQQLGQRRGQHRAHRVVVVAGRPAQEAQQRRGQQRLGVDHLGDRPQLRRRHVRALRQAHHHAHELLPPKGHAHATADRRRDLARQVIEQPAQRRVQRDL